MKLKVIFLLLCFSLLVGQGISLAQDTPQPIREAAISALNQLGIAGRPSAWQHSIIYNVAGSNLDCSLAPNTPLNVPVTVYIVRLTYGEEVYTVNVSEDTTRVIPCDNKLVNPNTNNPAPINSLTCPANFAGYLPPRLSVGGTGRVESSTGFNNIIRQNYGKSSLATGVEMPPGASFAVVGGPECTGANLSDPIVWWQVNYNGVVGWTAESQGSNYYLEPLTGGTGFTTTTPILQANLPQVPLRAVRSSINPSNANDIQLLGSGTFINPPAHVSMLDVASSGTVALALAPVSGEIGATVFYENLLSGNLRANWIYGHKDPKHGLMGFSPNGTTFAIAEQNELVFYRPLDGVRMGAVPYTGFISGSAYAPNGSRFAYWIDEGLMEANTYRASLRVFDGIQQSNVEYVSGQVQVWDAVFDSTSERLAILLGNGSIQILNLTSGTVERTFNVTLPGLSFAQMDYSFDGTLIAISATTEVLVYSVATGAQLHLLGPYNANGVQIQAIKFAQTSNLLAISAGSFPQQSNPPLPVTIFDGSTGNLLAQVQPTTLTRFLEFAGTDRYLLAAGDSSFSVWGLPQ